MVISKETCKVVGIFIIMNYSSDNEVMNNNYGITTKEDHLYLLFLDNQKFDFEEQKLCSIFDQHLWFVEVLDKSIKNEIKKKMK